MNLSITVDSSDRRITWASPGVVAALDIEFDELVGRSLYDVVDDASRTTIDRLFAGPPWIDRSFDQVSVVVSRPFGSVGFVVRRVRYFDRRAAHVAFIQLDTPELPTAAAAGFADHALVRPAGPELQPNGNAAPGMLVESVGFPNDGLTGLPLRPGLLAQLDAAPPDNFSVIVVVDIDQFGRLNARLGLSAGDAILAEFGARLAASVRSGDFAARLSGDRFAVLGTIDGGEQAIAIAIAERIERVLAEPFEVDGSLLSIATSIGVAWGVNGPSAHSLFEQAELALDAAQTNGGRQLRVYETNDAAGWQDLATFAVDLRHALAAGHIFVAYQPIVELSSGRLEKLEALARWTDPIRGSIAPNEFIPLAERSGTIGLLGEWILDRVCADTTRLVADGVDTEVSVNMSVAQLRDPAISSRVAAVLAENDVDPGRLWIEVTESVLLDDSAVSPLHDLHDLGLHLVIDDFGTGYATFQYLTRLPFDAVKIDTSFIAGLGIDASDTAIVRSVINLARELGLQVIAEGVETESQRAQLIALGCRLAQGWLFDRALPLDQLLTTYGHDSDSPSALPDAGLEEAQRIAALCACKILDTSADTAFDAVVTLATQILRTPIGLVSLLDSNRQWFKARIGVDISESARDISFCNHAIVHPRDPFVVCDALLDERFVDNPFVTAPPNIRSYAGVPIRSREGLPLGTLCVLDTVPRSYSDEQISQLTLLADQTGAMLDLRRRAAELSDMLHSRRSGLPTPPTDHVDVTPSARDGATAVGQAVVELTRASERINDTPGQPANVLRFGPLELRLSARAVLLKGEPLDCSAKEFDLLAFLSTNSNRAHTRSELLREVWHSTPEWQNASTVTEHIYRLRSKIEPDPAHPRMIVTVRNVGYKFTPPEGESNGEAPTTQSSPRCGEFIHDESHVVAADSGMLDLMMTDEPDDLIGHNVLDLVAPSSIAAAQARLEMRASGHTPGPQVLALRTTAGTDVVTMIESENAEFAALPAIVVSVREIIDPPQLSRQLVHGVINEVSDAVIVTDPDLHVLSWNPAAERLYGWSEHEVLGHTLQNVVRSLRPTNLATIQAETVTSGRWSTDTHHVTRDGTIVELISTMSVITDDSGTITAIVAVNRPQRERASLVAANGHTRSNWSDVQRAVNRNEFVVYYEPMVGLADRSIVGVNVRVRWLRPDGGTWDLADFITDVEAADALGDLARYVYPTAFLQFEQWHRAGRSLELSIDVSARQLADQEFLDALAPVVVRLRVAGSQMWLRIKESELKNANSPTRHALQSLCTSGARVAISEISSDWATEAALSALGVGAIVLDSALIDTRRTPPTHPNIAEFVAALGTAMSIPVWVENVSDEPHHDAAIRLGYNSGSGPLYGGPTLGDHLPITPTTA